MRNIIFEMTCIYSSILRENLIVNTIYNYKFCTKSLRFIYSLRVFVFEERLEIFILFRLAENAARTIIRGRRCRGEEKLEFLAEIGRFAVSDIFGAGHQAIIRLARRVVTAIFTNMEIGAAMRTGGAKPNFDGNLADGLAAFPAIDQRIHLSPH